MTRSPESRNPSTVTGARDGAAVLLVGNELLSGRVRDENLPFLASELWSLGMRVIRAERCRDDVDAIAEAVGRLAAAHTVVFTTGGIGPTHDDVTIRGVARAFGREVVTDPVLERLIRDHLGDKLEPAHLRMAEVPSGATLEGAETGRWPTVHVENVFVLPGVPWILRVKFERLRHLFRREALHRRSLVFTVDEARIAEVLRRAAGAFPGVDVGSYPESDRVLVVFEGTDEAAVSAAATLVATEASWALDTRA